MLKVAVYKCSTKHAFLKISQNSQENICNGVSFSEQVFSCEFFEICKNTFLLNTSGRLFLYVEAVEG